MHKAALLWAFCAVLSAHAEAGDLARFEVYPLGLQDPGSSLEAVEAIVGASGQVVLDEKYRRLLVLAPDELHRKIAALMDQLAVPNRNVSIEVEFRGQGTSRDSALGLHGHGEVVVGPAGTSGKVRVRPEVRNTLTTFSNNTRQSLLVASGYQGSLAVGEQVPYLSWLMDYGLHWGLVEAHVEWEQVGSRLVVEPTVLGDGPLIRVRLTPELSGWVNGEPQRIRFAQVATEVTVEDGQSFRIGGLNKDDSFYSRFLLGVTREGTQETLDIVLTPRIVARTDQKSPTTD